MDGKTILSCKVFDLVSIHILRADNRLSEPESAKGKTVGGGRREFNFMKGFSRVE